MKPAEQLEKEFEVFFTSIDFQRVSSILGVSPPFKNADFIKLEEQIIVELKILEKDFFKEGGLIDRFHSFVPIPKSVDEKGLGLYEFTFPSINREGKYDNVLAP